MKKHLFMMSLVIAFISCSKSDEDKVIKEENPKITSDTFSAVIKDGFTGENGEDLILYKNLKNIVVGDYIPYDITIKDKDSANTKYILTPTRIEEKNHQYFQIDYDIYLDNEQGEKVRVNSITFDKVGKHRFYIKPLVPGTFKLPFVLQREQNGQKVQDIKFPTLNFNAVKITVYIIRIGVFDVFGEVRFYIEDGENETDIYLSPDPSVKQTFVSKYGKMTYTGDFKVKQSCDVGPYISINTITSITIIQKREGEEEYRVEYYNIPIR